MEKEGRKKHCLEKYEYNKVDFYNLIFVYWYGHLLLIVPHPAPLQLVAQSPCTVDQCPHGVSLPKVVGHQCQDNQGHDEQQHPDGSQASAVRPQRWQGPHFGAPGPPFRSKVALLLSRVEAHLVSGGRGEASDA